MKLLNKRWFDVYNALRWFTAVLILNTVWNITDDLLGGRWVFVVFIGVAVFLSLLIHYLKKHIVSIAVGE